MRLKIVNTAKAIIFDGDNVLLIKKEYEDGRTLYTLPGGSQDPGETLQETLRRELYEEIAATVRIIDLVKVYEHQQLSNSDPGLIKHKIEFAFHCQLAGAYTLILGPHPDPHQTETAWISKKKLSTITLYPRELKNILLYAAFHGILHETGHYLGKVN
jgi:8-oxo-dGTP diphosphatase